MLSIGATLRAPRTRAIVRKVDHARRDGVVAGLVDEDEGARGVALRVGVSGDLAAQPEPDVRDVVEAQFLGRGPLERLEVDPAVDRVDLRRDGARPVLERHPVTGTGRAV